MLAGVALEGAAGFAGRTESTSLLGLIVRAGRVPSFPSGTRTADGEEMAMPEFPDRPDIDQLRHQARDLHRAATAGVPAAVTRIRAVSDRVSLASAQLAVAREYGYPSWPALRREVQRRRADPVELRARNVGAGGGWLGQRYSFGGGAPLPTAEGVLSTGLLTAGAVRSELDASAMLPARVRPSPAETGRGSDHRRRWQPPSFGDLTGADDQGRTYAARFAGGSIHPNRPGAVPQPSFLSFGLEPTPPASAAWVELRGQDGAVARLARSPQVALRVSEVRAVAAREVALRDIDALGYWLLESRHGRPASDMTRECAAARARSAEMQQSGGISADSELPRELARLCDALTERRLPRDLPARWQRFLDAASEADGPELHLDLATALPRIDGLALQLDHLLSRPEFWRLYLRVVPTWWGSADGRKWELVRVRAEDDRGGRYRPTFGGSAGHEEYEELKLGFTPRIDPLARRLRLSFGAGAQEAQAELDLAVAPAAELRRGRAGGSGGA
jgi:hypothetical protein